MCCIWTKLCAHRSHCEAVLGNVLSWPGKPLRLMAAVRTHSDNTTPDNILCETAKGKILVLKLHNSHLHVPATCPSPYGITTSLPINPRGQKPGARSGLSSTCGGRKAQREVSSSAISPSRRSRRGAGRSAAGALRRGAAPPCRQVAAEPRQWRAAPAGRAPRDGAVAARAGSRGLWRAAEGGVLYKAKPQPSSRAHAELPT